MTAMQSAYPHLEVQQRGDVFCVRFRSHRIPEEQIHEAADQLLDLAARDGCRKLALSLGPQPPEFLYSVFLAKLIAVQRALGERGCGLVLCSVGPAVRAIFEACRLDAQFRFVDDFDAAVAHWPG
jgi:anti-anti-sigma factor